MVQPYSTLSSVLDEGRCQRADAVPVYGRHHAAPQEALRHSLQTESQEALRTHRKEEEEQLLRAEREREALRDEARSLQRDRDLSLLQAETEKQQVRPGGLPLGCVTVPHL